MSIANNKYAVRVIMIHHRHNVLVTVPNNGARGSATTRQYIDDLLDTHFPEINKEHTFYTYTGKE